MSVVTYMNRSSFHTQGCSEAVDSGIFLRQKHFCGTVTCNVKFMMTFQNQMLSQQYIRSVIGMTIVSGKSDHILNVCQNIVRLFDRNHIFWLVFLKPFWLKSSLKKISQVCLQKSLYMVEAVVGRTSKTLVLEVQKWTVFFTNSINMETNIWIK